MGICYYVFAGKVVSPSAAKGQTVGCRVRIANKNLNLRNSRGNLTTGNGHNEASNSNAYTTLSV